MTGILNVMLADNASASVGPSPFTYVIGASAGSLDGSTYHTIPEINTTGADFFVAAVVDYTGGSGVVLSDEISTVGTGNTWHALTSITDPAVTRLQLYWSRPATVGASHRFVATGTAIYSSLFVLCFSGSNASPFDNQAEAAGNSAAASASTGLTPALNQELIVAAVSIDAGSVTSINSGFTISTDAPKIDYASSLHQGGAIAYKIQTAAAAVDPDWTLSTTMNWAAALACFKAV